MPDVSLSLTPDVRELPYVEVSDEPRDAPAVAERDQPSDVPSELDVDELSLTVQEDCLPKKLFGDH